MKSCLKHNINHNLYTETRFKAIGTQFIMIWTIQDTKNHIKVQNELLRR